jgi:hypothetical protein
VLHLTGWSAIGLAIATATMSIIGGPLLNAGLGQPPDVGEVGGGSVLLTLAAVTAVGAAISFGYWLRERSRPLAPAN